jgi:hypothetical protein
MEEIKTLDDLRTTYPDLVEQLENDVLERLGILDSYRENKHRLNENEKLQIRRRAKNLAGMGK